MRDPLGELEDTLAYMFELQKAEGHGRYINPLVAELKKSIEDFKEDRINLSTLRQTISRASPVIENYVDLFTVEQRLAALTESKNETLDSQNKKTDDDFISWVSQRIGKDFKGLNSDQQVQVLLTGQSDKELRVKLGVYLRQESDFLFNLAMSSISNFVKLLHSRLGFKFEKQQIAKAIHHHAEATPDNSQDKLQKLLHFLDKYLAPKGYSIEKLLSDPLAKIELENTKIIEVYLNPECAEDSKKSYP
jgi:hypothetical protein